MRTRVDLVKLKNRKCGIIPGNFNFCNYHAALPCSGYRFRFQRGNNGASLILIDNNNSHERRVTFACAAAIELTLQMISSRVYVSGIINNENLSPEEHTRN